MMMVCLGMLLAVLCLVCCISCVVTGTVTGNQDQAELGQLKSSPEIDILQELGTLGKEFITGRTYTDCSEDPINVTTNGANITSPGYPGNYPNGVECHWTIIAPLGQHVILVVNAFALEDSVNCLFDSLVIYDGSTWQDTWCGDRDQIENVPTSSGTIIRLTFTTDGSFSDTGFHITVRFTPQSGTTVRPPGAPCGGGQMTVTQDGYTITSPSYPDDYPNNADCSWLIEAPPGKYVYVTVVVFDLESGTDCGFDYLRAYEGDSVYSERIGNYCGLLGVSSTAPSYLTSSGNTMLLHFYSDASVRAKGFLLAVGYRDILVTPEPTVTPDECSGGYISSNGVHLVSPGYPNNYPDDADCSWTIEAPTGWYIYLEPIAFQVEVAHNCVYDVLVVYDGSIWSSPVIGSYCGVLGGAGSLPYGVVSSGNFIFMQFITDGSITYSGFNFRVNFIQTPVVTTTEYPVTIDPCDGVAMVTDDNAVITSPGYPGNYPDNARCQWRIVAPYGMYIHLLPDTFDVEYEDSCYYDSLEVFAGDSTSGHLLGVYCGLMGTSGQSPYVVSPGNELFLRFMTDGDITAAGFRIAIRFYASSSTTPSSGVCGDYVISGPGAYLNSPSYPWSYPSNIECHYHVQAPTNRYLRLVPEVFVVEDSVGCVFDAVSVFDGSSDAYPLVGRYCGTLGHQGALPMNVVSTGRDLYVVFTSDGSVTDVGFSFRVVYLDVPGTPPSVDGCSGPVGDITSDGSVIESPGYPMDYPDNAQCQWRITAPVSQHVELDVEVFSVENAYGCQYDALRLYSGSTAAAPLMGIFCGTLGSSNSLPASWVSPSNEIYLQFSSDGSVADAGFRIRVGFTTGIVSTTVPPVEPCEGGVGYISQHDSYISSPGYPGHYPNNAMCRWSIEAPSGKYIYLVPEVFSIESSHLCLYDALTVYAGQGVQSAELGRFCGIMGSQSALPYIVSSDNMLYLQFSTDGSVTDMGFNIRVEFYDDAVVTPSLPPPPEVPCSQGINIVTSHNTVITSPGYPGYYPNSIACEWLIQAPSGKLVSLLTEAFAVEESTDCAYDALFVYDGGSPASDVIGRYCGTMGNTEVPNVVSSSNFLFIKFLTDGSVGNTGFSIRVQFMDKGSPTPGSPTPDACSDPGVTMTAPGVLLSPAHPSNYPNNAYCSWRLDAPPGQHVYLMPQAFSLESSVGCIYDYLMVYDGSLAASDLIGRYCGPLGGVNSPPNIVSSTNLVYVVFVSDSSITDSGFNIQVQFYSVPVTTTLPPPSSDPCDGVAVITAHNTDITSPGYPGSYSNSLLCQWSIQAPSGMYIYLVPNVFDVESGPNCIYDTLLVYDGHNTGASMIGRYCGMMGGPTAPGVIVSSFNTMFVVFITDSTVTDIGFSFRVQFLHVPDITTTISPNPEPCGSGYQLVNYDGARIDSPGYPSSNYPHRAYCRWMIEAPYNMVIILVTLEFHVEEVSGCIYDSVSVHDGRSGSVQSLGRFCGNLGGPYGPPKQILSSTNFLFITFSSDGSVSDSGFSFTVQFEYSR